MSDVKWTEAQELAINHEGSDLLISAAAGSGKSATLTERIIRRIKSGKDISRMLIVTFTKAATGELKNKINTSLTKALRDDPSSAHIQGQLVKLGSADICTIDSFCMRLVKPNFDKLMIESDFRIGDITEIDILERDVMDEVLDELYESESRDEDFLLVVDCYSNLWNESLLGKALLDLRKKLLTTENGLDTLLQDKSYAGSFFDSEYGEIFKKFVCEGLDYFEPIYQNALRDFKIDSKGKSYIELFSREYDYILKLKKAFDDNKDYDEIKNIAHNIDFQRISSARLNDSLIPLAFYKDTRSKFKDFIGKINDELFASTEASIKSTLNKNHVICKSIYNILSKFESALIKRKRNISVYSFDDISHFALSLLYDENGEITDLAKSIASSYDEIYIDEYQDTNSLQDKIFKAISRNNRFMVGDIKQSIYRFRSAEPEIFSYYREAFDKQRDFNENSLGLSVFMSNNFRCDKKIIDFSNLVSDFMFTNSYGIPYESSDELIYSKSLPDNYEHASCEVRFVNSEGLGRGSGVKRYEAEYVARRIKHMLEHEKLPNGERIKKSHIAILLRNYSSNHTLYTEALERYGISSRFETSESFYEKPHIMLFISLLNAIDNPSKDISLAAAMRSFLFGFSLDELVKIKKCADSSASLYSAVKNYNKDTALRKKLDNLLNTLKEYKQAIRKMSAYESISYILGMCGILTVCNSDEKQDLIKLYNLAREYEASSFKGLYSFLKHLEGLTDDSSDKSYKGDNSKDNVKIMTIHASKGLEYEVCFICGLGDNFNASDTGAPILFHRHLGIAGYVGKENALAKFKTMARKCIALQLDKDMRDEEMRVLYVAMTRARSKLILLGSLSDPQKKLSLYKDGQGYITPFVNYNAKSLIHFVLGALCQSHESFNVDVVNTEELLALEENSPVKNELDRSVIDDYKKIIDERVNHKYKYDYVSKLPSKMSISRLYPEILDGSQNDDIEIKPLKELPLFLSDNSIEVNANERGTSTHVFMQFCNFENLVTHGVDAEIENLLSNDFISKRDSEIINKAHLNAFLKSDLLKDILKSKMVMREFRFNVMLDAKEFSSDPNLQNEKVLVQGVTDCIYENEANELVLVDYKTDFVTADNYEKTLKERHSTQLTYYKKACELMFERPISRVLIYSVPLAKTVEI